MAFENLKVQIALLLADDEAKPDDLHTTYQKVMGEINEMRAFGMPLPEDLVELERALEEKFSAEVDKTD